MARTRLVPRRRPNVNPQQQQMRDVDFQAQKTTIKTSI